MVVWSSASRVTVVPALRAARQIRRAFSRASLWPDLGQRLPDRGELDAHLRVAREAGLGERLQQLQVVADGVLGLRLVEGVLTEEVERDVQSVLDQLAGRTDRVAGALAGHVVGDDPAAHRHAGDDLLDATAPGEQQQCLTQHSGSSMGNRVPATLPPAPVRPEIAAVGAAARLGGGVSPAAGGGMGL